MQPITSVQATAGFLTYFYSLSPLIQRGIHSKHDTVNINTNPSQFPNSHSPRNQCSNVKPNNRSKKQETKIPVFGVTQAHRFLPSKLSLKSRSSEPPTLSLLTFSILGPHCFFLNCTLTRRATFPLDDAPLL